MEVKDIIELMKAVSDNGLTKFELEQGDTKLVMKREKQVVTVAGVAPVVATNPAAVSSQPAQGSETAAAESGNVVTCPLVGTFYASPSPEAESFMKIGDHVKKGQVLGIVEAMKLMNEIESEYDGVVEAILVENEDTVEYGQPLFRIR